LTVAVVAPSTIEPNQLDGIGTQSSGYYHLMTPTDPGRVFKFNIKTLLPAKRSPHLASFPSSVIYAGDLFFNHFNFSINPFLKMSAQFDGKYKLKSSENFDAFLKEIGIGLVTRKLANTASPTLEITTDGDYTTIKAVAPFKTQTTRFKLGEEFEEERMDGKKVKSVVTAEGNVFTQIQKDKDLEIKYVREFTDDEIKVTSICNGVSCLRIYGKI
ncbi:Lipocalin / cytosolic fatty-acid binding protein, partial [Tyrophagus putrescentiae]